MTSPAAVPDPLSDAESVELVRRARGHERPARDELLRRLWPRLLDRVEVMMGERARQRAEAADVVHNVLLDVMRDLDRFEPRGKDAFLRWACRIARHHILDDLRRGREDAFASFAIETTHLPAAPSERSPSSIVSMAEQKERLADALLQLPQDHRTVIALRHLEGLRFPAIAERLGRTENAVQLLHARALVRLGSLLRGGEG